MMPPTLRRHVDASGEPSQPMVSWQTAALFVDMGGFTRLTEELSRFGRDGLDELRSIINRFFGVAVRAVEQHGGVALRFEGDAVVCLFDDAAAATTAGREICSLNATVTATSAGPRTLRVSAGVGTGSVTSHVLGAGNRRQVIVLGPAIDDAVRNQETAGDGQVVVEDTSAIRPGEPVAGDVASPLRFEFVDPVVRDRIRQGHDALDEFRDVTIVFAALDGAQDHEQIETAIDVLDRAGGSTLTVTGDKGTGLLGVVGAPIALAEQRQRAMAAGLELRRRLGPEVRGGITSGTVFCGLIGGSSRADYTVLGDRVNLAARLMQLAEPGQVVVDQATWAGLESEVHLTGPRQVAVEGKVDLTTIATLSDRPPQSIRSLAAPPLVNQVEARRRLMQAWDAARASRGSLISLVGAAGTGKTRLLEDLAAYVTGAIYSIRFPRYRAAHPYEGFVPALRTLAGLDPGLPPTREQINAIITANLGWSPQRGDYLMRLLGGDHIAGDHSSEVGREILRTVAVDLITARAERQPIALLLDDAEAADSGSAALLSDLALAAPRLPLLIVAAIRGSAAEPQPNGEVIQLADLDAGDAAELAETLGADAGVVDRVGTNPLAITMSSLTPGASVADLRAMVRARIDGLAAPARDWIRSVSVLGQEFDAELAGTIFGTGRLTEIEASGLLRPVVGDRRRETAFTHDLVREVAYESLTTEHRRRLHRDAGLVLESATPPASPEELAHHFAETVDVDRQRLYFRLCGLRAADAFEFEDALTWFRRLKPISRGALALECSLKLGRWEEILGNIDRAAEELTEASTGDGVLRVEALAALARISRHRGASDEASRLLAQATATEAADPRARALVLEVRCEVGGDNMDPAEIEGAASELAKLAPDLGEEVLARAHHAIGTARFRLLDGEGAREELEEALIIADRLGNDLLSSEIRSDIAGTFYREERLQEALLYLSAAAEGANRIGYRRGAAGMLGNEALLRYRLGDVLGALRREHDSLRTLATMGERLFTIQGIIRAGLYFRAIGDDSTARNLLEGSIATARSTNQVASLIYALHHRARLDYDEGRLAEAEEATSEATALSTETGFHALDQDAAILSARIANRRGHASEALQILTTLEVESGAPEGVVAYERWLITRDEQERTRAASEYGRRHILAPSAHTARRLSRLTGERFGLPEVPDAGGELPAPEVFSRLLAAATPP